MAPNAPRTARLGRRRAPLSRRDAGGGVAAGCADRPTKARRELGSAGCLRKHAPRRQRRVPRRGRFRPGVGGRFDASVWRLSSEWEWQWEWEWEWEWE